MSEVTSTFQKRACYRYIRRTDKLPVEVDYDKRFTEIKCPIRLFNPSGAGTWWIASYDPENDIAWGVAEIHEREVGSFFMGELVDFRSSNLGLPIERDLYYDPRTIAEILAS